MVEQPQEDRHYDPRDLLLAASGSSSEGELPRNASSGSPANDAESDLREATGIARQTVGAWGMSDALWP